MDEKLKQQVLPPLAVFNLTAGIYMLVQFFRIPDMTSGTLFLHLAIAIGIGVVLGGITAAVTMRMK